MSTKKPLSLIAKITLLCNIGTSVALIFSYLAAYINPSTFWPLAFFGLAYPVLVVLNLFFLFYWIILGRWWFLLPLIIIAGGYNFLFDTFALREAHETSSIYSPNDLQKEQALGNHAVHSLNDLQTDQAPGKSTVHQLRAMTFNVHFFKRFDETLNEPVKESMLQLIRDEKPDILFIQEFFTRTHGKYTIKDSIRKIMHTRYLAYHACDSNAFESLGIALYSRYPIKNIAFVPLSNEKNSVNGAIYADIHLPGKTIRAFSVHLQSIRFEPQDYQFLGRILSGTKPNVESYRHIGSKLKLAFIHRSKQALTIAGLIKASPYPVIIAGDFNDPPVSFTYHTISKNLQNCFTKKGSGFAKTYNGSFPNFQIDYILCDSIFKVDSYHIIKKELSDHYPVRADLSWIEKQ